MKDIQATNLIIFDFDGTIADSLVIFIEATNRLAKDFGYLQVSSSQTTHLRTLSLREMIQELGIPAWKLPFFLGRFRKELNQLMLELQLVNGIKEALFEIKHQGYRLGIVTSNSRQNVEKFLLLQELNHLFEFIYGGQVLSGKARALKKLIRLNRVNPQQLIFIGDEKSDVKAAKQVGLSSIAVSWGFNDRSVLLEHTPKVLVDRPQQLGTAIAQVRGAIVTDNDQTISNSK